MKNNDNNLFAVLKKFYSEVIKTDIDSLKTENKKTRDIIPGMLADFYEEMIKPDIDRIDKKLDNLVQNITLKDSPSRVEFQSLKHKVEKIESISNN